MLEPIVENVPGWVGAATGAAALVITWWKTVRDARAEQPVLWVLTPERLDAPPNAGNPFNYSVKLSPVFADAHGFIMELYQPGDSGLPDGLQYTVSRPILKMGESENITLINGSDPGTAWIKLYWSHPRDVRRPNTAWFPVIPRSWNGLATPAADERLRQGVYPLAWQWFRAFILQSPVRPGRGILGRSTGWRDRRLGRRRLRDEGVKRWDPR